MRAWVCSFACVLVRTQTSAELLIDFTEQLLREGGEEETSNGLLQSITTYRRSLQTTAAAATQDQQSVSMATALLAVSARKGVTNLYDDAGLSQLCTFRKGLMEDEPTWKDYCLLQDDPKATGSGEAAKVYNKGTDVLSMFYGDADYDIDTIDTAVFATANFDDIVTAYSRFPPTWPSWRPTRPPTALPSVPSTLSFWVT